MIICRTPYRISFFGGGSDYPVHYRQHGGAVLATSIDKYCYVTCRYLPPFFEHKNRIVYGKIESTKSIQDIQHPVVRECLRFMDVENGVEIHHDSDIPARAGMGTSSSFTVGLLHSLYALQGRRASKRGLALNAIYLEQVVMKENVGSQDQVTAAYGGFNKITFDEKHEFQTEPITAQSIWKTLPDYLMLFFTGFSRTASEIAGEQIKKTPENKGLLIRMTEMVDEAIDILYGDDILEFGRLMHKSWQIKRNLTSKITNDQIDHIYNTAIKAGAIGGKLLGAGGGGFMLFFVEPEKQKKVKEALKDYLQVPFRFEDQGSQIIYYTKE